MMACLLFGTRSLSEPTLCYCQLIYWEHIWVKFQSKFKHIRSRNCVWKCRLQNGGHFGTNVLNIEVLSVLSVLGSLATFFFYQKSTEEHFVNIYCSYRIHLIDLFLIMNIVANFLLRMKCVCHLNSQIGTIFHRADSRVAPSQWETSLQSNTVSHWLGANLESATLISLKEFCNY